MVIPPAPRCGHWKRSGQCSVKRECRVRQPPKTRSPAHPPTSRAGLPSFSAIEVSDRQHSSEFRSWTGFSETAVGTSPSRPRLRQNRVKGRFLVSEQDDGQDTVEVEQVHRELTRGLKLCHSMVDDYRLKFAADLSPAEPANDDDEADSILG